jgi:hypothetical protein
MRQTFECIVSFCSCRAPISNFAGRFFASHTEKKSKTNSLATRRTHHESLLREDLHCPVGKERAGYARAVGVERPHRLDYLPVDVKQEHAQCASLCAAFSTRSAFPTRQCVGITQGRAWIHLSRHLLKNADNEENVDQKERDPGEGSEGSSRQHDAINQEKCNVSEHSSVKDTQMSSRDPRGAGANQGSGQENSARGDNIDAHRRKNDAMMHAKSSNRTNVASEQPWDDSKHRDYEEFMPGGMDDRIEDLFSNKLSDSRRAEKWTKSYACPTCTLR